MQNTVPGEIKVQITSDKINCLTARGFEEKEMEIVQIILQIFR